MPKGEGNRQKLLDAARRLFHEQGYTATGVNQITRQAGVPKGSFYNHFESKEQLAVQVVRDYADDQGALLDRLLVDRPGRPVDRVGALLQELTKTAKMGRFVQGCVLGNLCQELAGTNETLRFELDQAMRRVQRGYADVFFEAQQAGEMATDHDPDQLAAFLYNAWQGALMRAKATRSDQPLQAVASLLSSWIR